MAVLISDKDKSGKDNRNLYLFEPRLGLPVPHPKGIAAGNWENW